MSGQEVHGQVENILAALPQRRQSQGDHVEPEEEILAESSRLYFCLEVLVGSRDNAYVDGAWMAFAQPSYLALLKDSQQAHLRGGRDVADFVQKQGAVVGRFEQTDAVGLSASEASLPVAEEL